MRLRPALLATLVATAPALHAQTIYTGFTQNPTCVAGSIQNCATKFAPSGAALTARNNFFSNLTSSVATNSFETVAPGTTAPLVLNFGFAGNATLTGTGSIEAESPSVVPFGRFASSGSRYWQGSAAGTVSFGISFAQRVAGFGFYGIDLGDIGGSVSVRLFNGSSLLSTLVVQPQVAEPVPGTFVPELNGGMRFWGVLYGVNTFDRVEFSLTGNPEDVDVFAFDDLTVADASQVVSPVPEPSTYALMATGLAALAALRRRRQAPAAMG